MLHAASGLTRNCLRVNPAHRAVVLVIVALGKVEVAFDVLQAPGSGDDAHAAVQNRCNLLDRT